MRVFSVFLAWALLFVSCESKSKKELQLSKVEAKPAAGNRYAETKKQTTTPLYRIPQERAVTSDESAENQEASQKFYVFKVIDGDTFWMKDSAHNQIKVRLIGIDAPETRNTRYKKKGYFAQESKAYLQELIADKWVQIELDVQSRDRYGRLLAYVYTGDNIFVNGDLVQNGCAVTATFPPNVKYAEHFVDLERDARSAKKGMWK